MQTKETIAMMIAEQHSLSKAEARRIVNDVFNAIVEETSQEKGKVVISNFGTFEAVIHKARECKDISTGETITVEERNYPRFKAGKSFKNALKK